MGLRQLIVILLASAASPLRAQWVSSITTDEMTDVKTGVFQLIASSPDNDPLRPTLVFRCAEGALVDHFVVVHTVVAVDETVTLRWDADPAIEEGWSRSVDHKALFGPSTEQFVDSLFLHRKLLLRYLPYAENPQTASFAIPPFESIAAPLRTFCGMGLVERRVSIAAHLRSQGEAHHRTQERSRLAAANRRDVEAARLRRVGSVVLAAETFNAAGSEYVAAGLIRSVKDRAGRPVAQYRATYEVTFPDGRVVNFDSDTLQLDSGVHVVQVVVDGVRAPRTVTLIAP